MPRAARPARQRDMPTELVASARTIDAIRECGGALYVRPRKARCCGGAITLEAATEPQSLHIEISRRGRIRAFWNGLAWVEVARATAL